MNSHAFDKLSDDEIRKCFTEPVDPAIGRKILAQALDAARTDSALEDMRREIMEAKAALGLAGGGFGRSLAEEIRLALSRTHGRWIPCAERLPAQYERVLVWFDRGGNYSSAKAATWDPTHRMWSIEGCEINGRYGPADVTHWQPLPKGPA